VVAVYDVGTIDDRVWVAMEHIQGVTLRAWLAQTRRGWRSVLEVLQAVARGLGAAHAAGLVHRDVKPENIMIGDDGRVRVMDFGLARAGDADPETTPLEVAPSSLLASALTHTGSVIGTPIYMAPEGLMGAATDARADLFSWCVTCWEAVYGERPFAGETLDELTHNVTQGRRRPPPPGHDVPATLRRVLERGLEAEPGRRHPSMDALLAALGSIQRQRRLRALAAAGAMLSLGTALVLGAKHLEATATRARCAAAGAASAAVWGEDAALRVEASFIATGHADAADVFARTKPWLDAYANTWSTARTELCLASAAGAPEEDGLACLEERLAGLETLVEGVLARADEDTLTRAVAAAARLPPLSRCSDPTWLSRSPQRPADPSARARIAAVRIDIERSASLRRASKYDDAKALLAGASAEAEAIGWSPLVAETRLEEASLQVNLGEYTAAESTLERVVWQAEAEGYDSLVADATPDLTFGVGLGLGRPDDGIRWGRLGLAVLKRIGEEESLRATNNYASLAIVLESQGELDEAQALKEKVVTLREHHLGPDHPSVGNALNMMGALYLERGDAAAALRTHERALAIRLRALGPDHVEVATSYINIGLAHQVRGEPGIALGFHEKARQIFTSSVGPGHPDVGTALENMAECERALVDLPRALAHYRESQALRERALGPVHPQVGISLLGVGEILLVQGDLDGAQAALTRSLEVFEGAHGKDHPLVADALQRLADLRDRQGDHVAAIALLERAHAIRTSRDMRPSLAARIDFKLAQALWASDDAARRARARALLVEAAPTLLDDLKIAPSDERAAIRAWLDAHEAEVTAAKAVVRPGG
jgi:tetratricopeptide (TPR) repeat protein